jgi:hypothetical protein
MFCKMSQNYYHEQFRKNLIAESQVETFEEALTLWEVTGVRIDFPTECICTHPIVENCIVHHVEDGRELIIGNKCINQFFPEKEREKAAKMFKEIKNKTRNCEICKRRYTKVGSHHVRMCNVCNAKNNECVDCKDLFACETTAQTWRTRCPKCYTQKTGKPVKNDYTPVNGRINSSACMDCKKRIPVSPFARRCKRCYARWVNNES